MYGSRDGELRVLRSADVLPCDAEWDTQLRPAGCLDIVPTRVWVGEWPCLVSLGAGVGASGPMRQGGLSVRGGPRDSMLRVELGCPRAWLSHVPVEETSLEVQLS